MHQKEWACRAAAKCEIEGTNRRSGLESTKGQKTGASNDDVVENEGVNGRARHHVVEK
jgi:hypothetical protein